MCKASLPPGGRCRNPGSSLRGNKGPCACGQAGQAQTSAPWAGRAGLRLGSLCCAELLSRGWALGHQQELPDNELPHYLADCHCPQPPSAASPLPWHVPTPCFLESAPCILRLHPAPGAGWGRVGMGSGRWGAVFCAQAEAVHIVQTLECSAHFRQVAADPRTQLKRHPAACQPGPQASLPFPTRAAVLPSIKIRAENPCVPAPLQL